MKIKKNKKLVEDEVVNPDSKQEIEQEVEKQTDLEDNDVEKLANDIQKDADDTNSDNVVIALDPDKDYEDVNIVNVMTKALDKSLVTAQNLDADDDSSTANVLVEGLPGSGKTAIVKAWCTNHNLELLAFNATDPKLEASLNGIPLRDLSFDEKEEGSGAAITYAYNLKKVEKLLNPKYAGKCVLFVDELNRQKAQQLRRPFMSLFNEKTNADGTLDFSKNLLFSVICINPYGDNFHDPGVGELVPAELNRFLRKLKFDSNRESAIAYFDGWIKHKLLDNGVIPPSSKASDNHNGYVGPIKDLSDAELKKIKRFIKRYTLADYILHHPKFRFDERDDAHKIWLEKADYLTTRAFTNAIADASVQPGDDIVASFIEWSDNDSGMSKRVKDMFHEILDGKVFDWNEVWNDYGLNNKPGDASKAAAATKDDAKQAPVQDDDGQEDSKMVFDDDDVDAAGNKASGTTSSSTSQVKDVIKNWTF